MRAPEVRPIVLAAGGTAGHMFPADAVAAELAGRGHRVVLMTDARGVARDAGAFEARIVLPGAGIAGRGARRGVAALLGMARGVARARASLRDLRACAVLAFGGYPAVAPVLAARTLGIPVLLHEQNAVLGRANRFLVRRAETLALSFAETARVPHDAPALVTGNAVRAAIAPAPLRTPDGTLRVLVLGGSLGARVMSDIVPPALSSLAHPALRVVQQCRPEDVERVRAAYAAADIPAELAGFFEDMPARLAAADLVIARAGASTVAELALVGRPALLIPLPGAIDDHQTANANAIGARVLIEPVTPQDLRAAIASLLPTLAHAAARIAEHGMPHAARALADLAERYVTESARA